MTREQWPGLAKEWVFCPLSRKEPSLLASNPAKNAASPFFWTLLLLQKSSHKGASIKPPAVSDSV